MNASDCHVAVADKQPLAVERLFGAVVFRLESRTLLGTSRSFLSRVFGVQPDRAHAVRVERDLVIPAGDGVPLLANRFYPADIHQPPVVLLRSPYGRGVALDRMPQLLAERGYQVLFAERGYDETTIADIAAAAGVTQMTFFRHFPAKELVVVDDPYDPAIAQAVAAQPVDLPVVERVRRGLLAAWGQLEDADDAEFRLRLRIGAGHRGLRARMRENSVRTEAAIAAALADGGVPVFEAVVAAPAVIGALTAALLEWANDPDAGPMGNAVTAALALLEIRPLR